MLANSFFPADFFQPCQCRFYGPWAMDSVLLRQCAQKILETRLIRDGQRYRRQHPALNSSQNLKMISWRRVEETILSGCALVKRNPKSKEVGPRINGRLNVAALFRRSVTQGHLAKRKTSSSERRKLQMPSNAVVEKPKHSSVVAYDVLRLHFSMDDLSLLGLVERLQDVKAEA